MSSNCRWYERAVTYVLLAGVHAGMALAFLLDRTPNTDAAYTGFPLDDAWIHLVYGRALAEHGLPYYNDGLIEAGFTSPAWVAALGLVELVSESTATVVLLAKIGSVLCALLTTLGLFELCLWLTSSRSAAAYGAVLAAFSPLLGFVQVSGMEAALACTCSVWALYCFAKNRHTACGVILAVAYLARPELVVLLVCIGMAYLGARRWRIAQRAVIREFARLAVPTGVVMLLWAAFCVQANGHILPNTFYVKFSPEEPLQSFANVLTNVIMAMPATLLGSGILLYVAGAAFAWSKKRYAALPILLFPWCFLAGVSATRFMPELSGSQFYFSRYAVPALPCLFLTAATGLDAIWNFHQTRRPRKGSDSSPRSGLYFRIFAALLVIVSFWSYPKQIQLRKREFAWNCQNINEVQVAMGKWINRYTPTNAGLFVLDAGASRYLGDRRTFDMVGLNNSRLVFDRRTHQAMWTSPRTLAAIMEREDSNYLVIFPKELHALTSQRIFHHRFQLLASFKSPHYTIASPSLDTLAIYRLSPG